MEQAQVLCRRCEVTGHQFFKSYSYWGKGVSNPPYRICMVFYLSEQQWGHFYTKSHTNLNLVQAWPLGLPLADMPKDFQ